MKMKKRMMALGLAAMMAGSMVQGAYAGETTEIYWLMNSPEYSDAFDKLFEEYKKIDPSVNIEIEITQDPIPLLKTKIASGNVPDIFVTTVGTELEQYDKYSYDVSQEPYVDEFQPSIRESLTYDGKVVGLPLFQLGLSIIYNKDIFEQCGITELPMTLSELEEVCEILVENGFTPFVNDYKDLWMYKHIFNPFLSACTDNVAQTVADFKAGEATFADYPLLDNYFKYVDLTLKYGQDKPLETDQSAEISIFAQGQAAMATGQGSYLEDGIMKINPDMNIGLMPMPVSEDPSQAKVVAGLTHCLRISKDSEALEKINEFFNWIYTSDFGKQWFPNDMKCMGCINDVDFPNMQLAASTLEYVKANEVYAPAMVYSDEGFQSSFGETMQAYIGGAKTKEEAVKAIEEEWLE